MPDPQIYSTSRVFLIVPVSSTSAEQSTYLLEKSDLTSEPSVAGTGCDVRDELFNKRQRRSRRWKVFFDQCEENRYLSYGAIRNELLGENDGEIGEGDRLVRSRRRLISRTIFSTGSLYCFYCF